MDEENGLLLLQKYRRDRRILLDFILSGSLLTKVVIPPGAVTLDDVDLDQVSVDHVLNCAKKGVMLELSDAIRDYHDSITLPHMGANGTAEYFLVTDSLSSGPPPRRPPPLVPPVVSTPRDISLLSATKSQSFNSSEIPETPILNNEVRELTVDDIEDFEDDDIEEINSISLSRRSQNDVTEMNAKLPAFATGVTDDDLRGTAYEVLLACAGATGGLIVPSKENKKEKKSLLMRKLGRRKSGSVDHSQRTVGLVALLEIMRAQMEIIEEMDIRTRQGLLNALVGKVGKRMDTLLVPLELLCCISRTEFSDKKAYLRWQKRQLFMLEEGLINHPTVGFGESGAKGSELRILLAKIEESEFQPSSTGDLQRTECLRALREIAVPLAERPARGDLTGEVCHWADGYHLNVRLYEKLLSGVFDATNEGKMADEAEEILELLKSTWRVLGITETIHFTCFSWVLFRQYVLTLESELLHHTLEQLKKIPLKEQRGPRERLHMKELVSRYDGEELSFLQSFLLPIQSWVNKALCDYHRNYAEDSSTMSDVLKVGVATSRLLAEESDLSPQSFPPSERDLVESFITSSIKNVFARTVQDVDKLDVAHTLVLLAEETKQLIGKESKFFSLVLSQRHPQAVFVSVSLLHKLYGHKLKPFLEKSEHLTEDVALVFPVADDLEQYIMATLASHFPEDNLEYLFQKLVPFNVLGKSGELASRWINMQLERILGWIERAIQQEQWSPISPQQRHGSSIVEIYRIVEETVDRFFALKVPFGPSELNILFRGIDNAFQTFANLVMDKLVTVEDLIPPVPVLTRYKKEAAIKAFVKKELSDSKMHGQLSKEVDVQTTHSLCIRLNTLYYAISHLNKMEDSIWDQWTAIKPRQHFLRKSIEKSTTLKQKGSFDGSRKIINSAIDRLCEVIGTKIVFWDLRAHVVDNMYRNNVAQSRIDVLIAPLDTELNNLCGVVVDTLRDRIVTSLLQATLDGFLRVVLDGGSSRMFTAADAKILEEDLEILKEFFISGGDGLPRGIVENHLARPRLVIKLLGYDTRELVDELKAGSSKLGGDTPTLLRILCHRPDSEASQFLKKQFKIPKSSS